MKFFLTIAVFTMFSLFALATQAATEPQNIGEVINLIPEIQNALEGKNYAYLAVLGLMLATFVIKRFFLAPDGSQNKKIPAITSVMGALFGAAASAGGGGDPMSGAVGGLMAGNAANGAYDLLFESRKKKK